MKQVYIGYTSYHDVLYQVAKHSIEKRSENVECIPIIQQELRDSGIYTRGPDKKGSTEFSITRFLTPWLANYNGWVLFCDNDIVALEDVNHLFEFCDDSYAIMCVKHEYQPSSDIKLDGRKQTQYPRKNWSSVILWNCQHPKNKIVTPDLINTVEPLFLHRFQWLEDDDIGELPFEWNWLVGWSKESENSSPKLLHFTEGGPYFSGYKDVEYANVWKHEYESYAQRKFTEKDFLD